MKRKLSLIFAITVSLLSFLANAHEPGSGLEIESPHSLHIVYTIEPDSVDSHAIQSLVETTLAETSLETSKRDDAQLILRVEEHAGSYLLYLDFSRQLQYEAQGKRYLKDGYVWGRYAKNITDMEQLLEDVSFFFEEFLQKYQRANNIGK